MNVLFLVCTVGERPRGLDKAPTKEERNGKPIEKLNKVC